MTLVTRRGTGDGYEAVIMPAIQAGANGAAVFRRRSARPSRRAVLHLHDLAESFAPADLARWYNDRGFHFYVADLDPRLSLAGPARRIPRPVGVSLHQLDLACAHLREEEGIAKIILSAHGPAALAAALWCDTRRDRGQADALILTDPVFSRSAPARLDIACPVLVISGLGNQPGWSPGSSAADRSSGPDRSSGTTSAGQRPGPSGTDLSSGTTGAGQRPGPSGPDRSSGSGRAVRPARAARAAVAARLARRPPGPVRLGAHVTWLNLDHPAPASMEEVDEPGGAGALGQGGDPGRQLFSEMGRWLGAYMYGRDDQLI